jgi:thiamine-phosphate pyrophosphorylase
VLRRDRPDLVAAAGADGVHVGQDDVPVDEARAAVGRDRVVGLSTHSVAQADRAGAADVDYFAVGPVHATPTKEGRPPIGLDPIRHAARTARRPWFAIGGLDLDTTPEVLAAGARRIVVVRAIAEADDPGDVARRLRRMVEAAV